MKVLTLVSHPRTDSLTFAVANEFIRGLGEAGHQSEMLDLHRCGFDPVLREADEPDWTAERQHFSAEVEAEMERMRRHDALAFVFPLWWWSVPALMKGYIDRVWNYGFAYGPERLPHRHVLWLALAGAPIERFEKRKYHDMIEHYFNVGLASYCGIGSSKVALLYETIVDGSSAGSDWLNEAYQLGVDYPAK